MHQQYRPSNRLIIICGLSFAGKSTLADAICAEFGYSQVDVDQTKLDLHGPGIDDTDLNPDEWDRIYRETDERILFHLRKGGTVVDASRNFRRRERDHARRIAEQVGVEMVVIYVDTPEWLVRRRWAQNKRQQARRDVSEAAFGEIISIMEPPTVGEEALVFRYDDDMEDWLCERADELGGKRGSERNDL
ncbi:MAG: ATP-binding protein [Anaerolineae bacterium]